MSLRHCSVVKKKRSIGREGKLDVDHGVEAPRGQVRIRRSGSEVSNDRLPWDLDEILNESNGTTGARIKGGRKEAEEKDVKILTLGAYCILFLRCTEVE